MKLLRGVLIQYDQCPYKTKRHQGRLDAEGWPCEEAIAACPTARWTSRTVRTSLRTVRQVPVATQSVIFCYSSPSKAMPPSGRSYPSSWMSRHSTEGWLLPHACHETSRDQPNRRTFSSLWISRAACSTELSAMMEIHVCSMMLKPLATRVYWGFEI